MANEFRSSLVCSSAPANPALETDKLFDRAYRESSDSPIDEFTSRVQLINTHCPHPDSFDHLQGQLILLGVVAAVESYIRTLFRRLIYFDPMSQEQVQHKDVSFGAAIHLPAELLPEAILERISFVSKVRISEAIRDLIGVKGAIPPELDLALEDYERVCQLRNCAVHRFGKLGSNNAIKLGLAQHSELLEKPLKLDYAALQSSIAIATGLVKTMNNFLFNVVVSRLPNNSWSGNYNRDKNLFRPYYDLFADRASYSKTPNVYIMYNSFMKQRSEYYANKR